MAAHQDPANENSNTPSSADYESRVNEAQAGGAAAPEGIGAADAGLDPLEALQARLVQLEAEKADLNEQLLRAVAEVENVRRRSADDVTKARKFGIESFAESLVPVKDSLEAALAQAEQTPEAWREGVETTLRQLSNAFERNRLADIDPAVGERFDPHLHQAISSVPAEQPANTVVQVLQKGYLISDRVLRPALVMVAA